MSCWNTPLTRMSALDLEQGRHVVVCIPSYAIWLRWWHWIHDTAQLSATHHPSVIQDQYDSLHECCIHEHSTYLRGPWLDKDETWKDCHQGHLGCSWVKHLCYGWDNATHVTARQVLGDDVCIIPWRLWTRTRIVSDWKMTGWDMFTYIRLPRTFQHSIWKWRHNRNMRRIQQKDSRHNGNMTDDGWHSFVMDTLARYPHATIDVHPPNNCIYWIKG